MFEKEAEEKYCKGCKLRMEHCLWAWRSVNGLNEPNEKNCSCKEVPTYIAGAEFGYNKANEWHYVKDGDFPKEEGVYLTYRKNGFQLLAFDGAYWVTGIQDDVRNTIIAWKEVVLPELRRVNRNEQN